VAGGDELNEVGVVLADEHAALVAGADDGGLDSLALAERLVAVVRTGRHDAGAGGAEQALHEGAPRRLGVLLRVGLRQPFGSAGEVFLAGLTLFGGQVDSHERKSPRDARIGRYLE